MYKLYFVSCRVTYPKSIATQEVTKLALIYRGRDMFNRIISCLASAICEPNLRDLSDNEKLVQASLEAQQGAVNHASLFALLYAPIVAKKDHAGDHFS